MCLSRTGTCFAYDRLTFGDGARLCPPSQLAPRVVRALGKIRWSHARTMVADATHGNTNTGRCLIVAKKLVEQSSIAPFPPQ